MQILINALYGALVGDAYGVPHEFKQGYDIPPSLAMVMPADYPKSHGAIPYGVWSDDSAMLLCLLESLLENERVDREKLVTSFGAWLNEGRHQWNGIVFDAGLTNIKALEAWRGCRYSNTTTCASKGNGSLMRVLPVALYGHALGVPVAQLASWAVAQGDTTHSNAEAGACCLVYTLLAINLLKGDSLEKGLQDALQNAGSGVYLTDTALLEAVKIVAGHYKEIPTGSGYCTNTFWSAIYALRAGKSYEDVLHWAISLGNDTDTVACVAGGLAGLLYEVPSSLIATLKIPVESQQIISAFTTLCEG